MPTILNRRDGKPTMEVFLAKGFTLIGKSVSADIRIDDIDAIEERASIVKVGEDYIINDLSAAGGMLVNGKPVKKQVLHDRDLITIGEYRMTFQDKREKDEPVGIESEAAEIRLKAEMAKRPLEFDDPFRKGSGGKSTVVVFAVLGAIILGIGYSSYRSYGERKAADAKAASASKAYDEKKRKEADTIRESARAIGSSINGNAATTEAPATK